MTARTTSSAGSDATAAMIDANLELSRRFFSAAFDNPSLLEDVPTDATLVLIPIDDPDLARANVAAAEREASLGKRVVLRIVGVPRTERPGWDAIRLEQVEFTILRPRWPEGAEDDPVSLHYFQDTDVLVARFADDDRVGIAIPWHGPAILLVELDSQEVLGYLLPRFVEGVVGEAPHLRDWLRQARIHDRTPDEVRLLLSDVASEPRLEPTVTDVREGIGDRKLAG
jgi:hypothetical protein